MSTMEIDVVKGNKKLCNFSVSASAKIQIIIVKTSKTKGEITETL